MEKTTVKKYHKIYIAGHNGMVGQSLLRYCNVHGYNNIITANRDKLDLTCSLSVNNFIADERPDVVILAAAKVGGIQANNTYPADFISENLSIAYNVISSSYYYNVPRLLFLGSSCIYPKHCRQPITEDQLLTGSLEPTNEPYAIAKIAGLKLCQYYRKQYGARYHSVMPTNLYGFGDNYHPENSHVLPALIYKIHEAKQKGKKEVVLWGDGTPEREFLFVDDLAKACFHLLQIEHPPDWINVGTGIDISIYDLAYKIKNMIGYRGDIQFDTSKPNGTKKKLLDVTQINNLGWYSTMSLDQGLGITYQDFLNHTPRMG